jgi:hypothetical protein
MSSPIRPTKDVDPSLMYAPRRVRDQGGRLPSRSHQGDALASVLILRVRQLSIPSVDPRSNLSGFQTHQRPAAVVGGGSRYGWVVCSALRHSLP